MMGLWCLSVKEVSQHYYGERNGEQHVIYHDPFSTVRTKIRFVLMT